MKPRKGLNSFNDHFQWLDVKMPVRRQSEGFLEVAKDLELLCIEEEVYNLDRAKELCEKRVAELRKTNGTLEMVSSYWSVEVKHTYLIKTETCKTFILDQTKKPISYVCKNAVISRTLVEMISAMLMECYYLRRTADLRNFIQLKS